MSKVYFMNQGNFDVRAMLTFGVSAKDNSNAIGFFGTGFKYAIAIILRNNGKVRISTLDGIFEFKAKKEKIRNEEFDIVYMNDKEAGFTTRLGINWEPWMAFRELYCNAKDEHGEIAETINTDFDTIIEVDCPAIHRAYIEKSNYFLDTELVTSKNGVDFHKNNNSGFIYYKGVAVLSVDAESAYSYNLTSFISLTEDRTVKYSYEVGNKLQRAWQELEDSSIIRKIVRNEKSFESTIGFSDYVDTSEVFLKTCREMQRSDKGICEPALALIRKIDEKSGDWPEFYLTKVQLEMMNRAKEFLIGITVNVDDFPIKTVQGLGSGVMGRALDGVIYISDLAFQMGTKQLTSTLLEEWVHNKTGAADFDRVMQNWLFDKILSIGEELNGKPI